MSKEEKIAAMKVLLSHYTQGLLTEDQCVVAVQRVVFPEIEDITITEVDPS